MAISGIYRIKNLCIGFYTYKLAGAQIEGFVGNGLANRNCSLAFRVRNSPAQSLNAIIEPTGRPSKGFTFRKRPVPVRKKCKHADGFSQGGVTRAIIFYILPRIPPF